MKMKQKLKKKVNYFYKEFVHFFQMSNSQYVTAIPMYTHINVISCIKITIYSVLHVYMFQKFQITSKINIQSTP